MLEPLPLVLVALAAGAIRSSVTLARRSDLILAVLVVAVALSIAPARLRRTLAVWRRIVVLALLPLVTLLPLAVALGRLFGQPQRDGLLALGLAPSEVATAGLVALAAGDAAAALALVACSLAVSALAAPWLAPLLAGGELGSGRLLHRFALVVLVPLAAGLAVRLHPRTVVLERAAERATAPVLALLVYAALGDLGTGGIAFAVLAATAFLAVSLLAAGGSRLLLGAVPAGWTYPFALRDFAVAAALAAQLPTAGAGAVPIVYGVLMLAAGAAAAGTRGRRVSSGRPASRDRRMALERASSAAENPCRRFRSGVVRGRTRSSCRSG